MKQTYLKGDQFLSGPVSSFFLPFVLSYLVTVCCRKERGERAKEKKRRREEEAAEKEQEKKKKQRKKVEEKRQGRETKLFSFNVNKFECLFLGGKNSKGRSRAGKSIR